MLLVLDILLLLFPIPHLQRIVYVLDLFADLSQLTLEWLLFELPLQQLLALDHLRCRLRASKHLLELLLIDAQVLARLCFLSLPLLIFAKSRRPLIDLVGVDDICHHIDLVLEQVNLVVRRHALGIVLCRIVLVPVLRAEATRLVLSQLLVEHHVLLSHLLGLGEVARGRSLGARHELHIELIRYSLDLLRLYAAVLVNAILKYRLVVALGQQELLLLLLEYLKVSLVVRIEQ